MRGKNHTVKRSNTPKRRTAKERKIKMVDKSHYGRNPLMNLKNSRVNHPRKSRSLCTNKRIVIRNVNLVNNSTFLTENF